MVFISLAKCVGGKTVPAMRTDSWPFHLCTTLTSRPMTVIFGLGTRVYVRMCTKLENGVLSNGQRLQCVVNGFVDQGESEAMKTLSGWEAVHCDEHPFRAKIKVSA